ncbi:hypothetical protein TrispH2_003526 [Trichoplax sp. H2]|uniref:Uncharacterized protein n=1 Tax=Trichoplax adhaerens TaxID=10228 RepID=B3SAZ0_TRIAD|nr:hypothetical protein TRIADDRAFT_61431 [Trichoplax adhaerens]EDV20016.1 hypothetical protein TRIADDRAFT_61431 [Trichoplax adhaerens]RDD45523.1 hypothetical protein TrispH2_003526 [Trichoplax sp. H2]|eukprot:XP_002117400.1 hypothetical protein TRIADDRAFT_61431 [Trichoplax adhaerens]
MAFFNVTRLGVQDPVKASLRDEKETQDIYDTKKKTLKVDVSTERKTAIKLDSSEIYKDKRRRHERSLLGPKEVYQTPMTTSQEYGWHDNNEKEPWMQSKRHVHVNSEMTKFVKSMALTNRDFSLY